MKYTLSKFIVGILKILKKKNIFEEFKLKQLATKDPKFYSIANFFHIYYLDKRNIGYLNSLYLNDFFFDIPLIYKNYLISLIKNLKFNLVSVYPSDIILLWYLIRKYRVNNILETGTGFGYSTILIYEGLKILNERKISLQTYGLPTLSQKRYTEKLFKNYPEIEYFFGKVPKIFKDKKTRYRSNLGIFIDGPKGSSKEFDETLKYIFDNFKPKFVAIHDCEYHLPSLKENNYNKRINYTRSKLAYFYYKNLNKSNYKLIFFKNEKFKNFSNFDKIVFRSSKKIKPYFFKNAHNLSYSPCIGVICLK